MPTNRVRIKRAVRSRVTDEAIALLRFCEEIVATGQDETFEDEGGRRREYLDAHVALDSAVGVKLWESRRSMPTARPRPIGCATIRYRSSTGAKPGRCDASWNLSARKRSRVRSLTQLSSNRDRSLAQLTGASTRR